MSGAVTGSDRLPLPFDEICYSVEPSIDPQATDMKSETAKRRFLVADDHPLYLEAVCGRLQRLFPGADIVELASLDDLAPLDDDADRFDLILIDLRMPGMNGPESVARIVEQFPEVPVVIMSGAASPNDVRAAVAAGARGFFPRPCRRNGSPARSPS